MCKLYNNNNTTRKELNIVVTDVKIRSWPTSFSHNSGNVVVHTCRYPNRITKNVFSRFSIAFFIPYCSSCNVLINNRFFFRKNQKICLEKQHEMFSPDVNFYEFYLDCWTIFSFKYSQNASAKRNISHICPSRYCKIFLQFYQVLKL